MNAAIVQRYGRRAPGRLVQWLLVALPLATLACMAMAWLRYGIDLPYRDDWREYLSGDIASLDLSHLFRSDNDTMSVTTRVFDALAQRLLDGNSIAYQFLTMVTVLGALLWLQWKLLAHVLRERTAVACAFVATLFMLQPGSYWGLQNLAYIQAIPAACLLALLYVAIVARWSPLSKGVAAFAIAAFSGLTYISGALSMLAAACVLAIATVPRSSWRRQLLPAALPALAGAIATTAAQLWVILVVQGGKTHRADAPWALPMDADFWAYALGKVARSLLLPESMPMLAMALAALLVVATTGIALLLSLRRDGIEEAETPRRQGAGLVTLALLAGVGIYLCMVAAGRANLRPARIDTLVEVFQFGYQRFHFFWVTLLWPWLVAGCLLLARRFTDRAWWPPAIGAAGIAIAAFALVQGAAAHMAAFQQVSAERSAQDLACLQRSLAEAPNVTCPSLAPYGDLTDAYRNAVRLGASFVRYVPPSLLASNERIQAPTVDVLARPDAIDVHNAQVLPGGSAALDLTGGRDPQLVFSTGDAAMMAACVVLEVDATLESGSHDVAQLFYRKTGEPGFSEASSLKVEVPGGAPREVEFLLVSRTGFVDHLRLDPVRNFQPTSVSSLSVRCLL